MLHNNLRFVRRAKPYLGTIVDIQLSDSSLSRDQLIEHSEHCFKLVSYYHDLLTYFESTSDIGHINLSKPSEKVLISSDTKEILDFSKGLYALSDGHFDVMYKDRGLYPHADFEITDDNYFIKNSFAKINLGGVAKGYIVDKVSEYIRDNNIYGIVNAGGDIAFIGQDYPLKIRSPFNDGRYFDAGSFSNCCIATSVFNSQINPISITVRSDSCMTADALTKVLFGLKNEEKLKVILGKFEAQYIPITNQTTQILPEFIK